MSNTPSERTENLQRLGGYLQSDPSNAHLLRDYAREAAATGELAASIAALKKLIASADAASRDFALMGAVQRASGAHTAALATLQAGRTRWPDDAAIAIETARTLFATGDLEAASDALPQRVTDPSLAAETCALQVRLLHHAGDLDRAIETGERFLAHASDARVAENLVPVLLDVSRVDDAVALARGLVESGVATYAAYEALAVEAMERDATQEATGWTARALSHRRDDGRIWLLEGMARLRAGEAPAAVQALERAVELQPRHAGSHLSLGWTHLMQQQPQAARAAFEQAVQASPAFSEGYGSLAVVHALEGRRGEAQELLRKARGLDRTCASALYADALLAGKDAQEINRIAQAFVKRLQTHAHSGAAARSTTPEPKE